MAKRKLFSVTIKDCEVQTFRAGGKGGQNQNKRDTGVRISHAPSGAVGVSREQRSQLQNKRTAFERMAKSEKFQTWARIEALGLHDRVEKKVDEMMKNIVIEGGEVHDE